MWVDHSSKLARSQVLVTPALQSLSKQIFSPFIFKSPPSVNRVALLHSMIRFSLMISCTVYGSAADFIFA